MAASQMVLIENIEVLQNTNHLSADLNTEILPMNRKHYRRK